MLFKDSSEAASPGRRCSQPTMLSLDLAGLRGGLARSWLSGPYTKGDSTWGLEALMAFNNIFGGEAPMTFDILHRANIRTGM